MDTYLLVCAFVLGTIIGSFLDVVVLRLHTGKSLNGRSRCFSCGKTLRWYELFPIVSYILLRGRCMSCGAKIPTRHVLVELGTGAVFALIWYVFREDLVFAALNGTIATLLIGIVLYDLRHTIIPDEFVLILLVIAAGTVYAQGISVLTHVVAALGLGGFFALFWMVSQGRWMGLGDAKLAVPLGLLVGPLDAISVAVLSFWIGAAISVSLIGIQWLITSLSPKVGIAKSPRYLTMKSEVPFAPFLVLGFACVYFFHVTFTDILNLFPFS